MNTMNRKAFLIFIFGSLNSLFYYKMLLMLPPYSIRFSTIGGRITKYLLSFSFMFAMLVQALLTTAQDVSKQVRVIMIGAHPDDCDQDGGGAAALFASME